MKNQLSWIVEHWVLLGALLFVSVYIYFSGYFWIVVGLPNPPLAVSDVSLSAATLAAKALFAYNIWTALEGALKLEGRRRLVVFVFLTIALLITPCYQIYQYDWTQASWHRLYNTLWIIYILVIAVLVAFSKTPSASTLSILSDRGLVLAILVAALVYLSGIMAGMQDLRTATMAHLSLGDMKLDVRVLRIMSETIVAFDLERCEVVLLPRSSVESIRTDYFGSTEPLTDEELNCSRKHS